MDTLSQTTPDLHKFIVVYQTDLPGVYQLVHASMTQGNASCHNICVTQEYDTKHLKEKQTKLRNAHPRRHSNQLKSVFPHVLGNE